MKKKILMALIVILIVIQFFRPGKNIAEGVSEHDISKVYQIPHDVVQTFQNKCYDCHSHNTKYPWYYNIQPVAWWMDFHVREGKNELNFSDFKNYDAKRANHKLEELAEVVNEGTMPIKSYLWTHGDAKLTPDETVAITNWVKSLGVVVEGH